MKIWFRVNCNPHSSWEIVAEYLYAAFSSLKASKREGLSQVDDVTHYTSSPPSSWSKSETVEMWWGNPVDWQWSDEDPALRVGICLSEARSILSRDRSIVLENVAKCDVILCPSHHAANAFLEAPFDTPIHIVPFGIDPEECTYVEREWDGDLFFLHMGRTQFRKGSWMVPDAFIRTLGKAEKAYLTIACMDNPTDMYQKMMAEYGNHPRINFVDGFKESAMEYYSRHHILVSPHLAEGWGLCIPEALATGMAGIVARCSAPVEFFRKDYGWWIEMSERYVPLQQCLTDTGGQWRLPDIDSLANAMLEAYNNRKRCRLSGITASNHMRQNYTWSHTATAIREVLHVYQSPEDE